MADRKLIPIACTLNADELGDRTSEWRDVLGRATARVTTPDGMRIGFPSDPSLAATLAELAAKEADCCAFFGFQLAIEHGETWLEVTAPPDGQTVLTALFA